VVERSLWKDSHQRTKSLGRIWFRFHRSNKDLTNGCFQKVQVSTEYEFIITINTTIEYTKAVYNCQPVIRVC